MERLQERLAVAQKALERFEEAVAIEKPSPLERDATIQRFEFTFEAVWKAAKNYLFDVEGIDLGSPKSVVRACREVGLLDEQETMEALRMVDDRNMTVHTYNEDLAEDIYSRLGGYSVLMAKWLKKIEKQY